MTDIEIWKDIKDYEGLFQVSNLGRVKSLGNGGTHKTSRIRKLYTNKYGYLQVSLCKDGKKKMCRVHRLVAEAFLPNPENKPYINHKIEGDEGKKINMVIFNTDGSVNKEKSTIEWVTAKENINYGTHNERVSKTLTNGKLSKKVLQFTLDGDLIREWESTHECGRNGFNRSHVAACCRGNTRLKTYKGFIWKYKETL